MDALVSIIIPIYNDCRFLHETITSILNQTIDSYEIIIIDDCSNNSMDIKNILNSFENEFIYFRNATNKGLAESRNVGLSYAKGKYLVFLDADDIIHPKKIEKQKRCLEENQEVDFVFSDEDFIIENKYVKNNKIFEFKFNDDFLLLLLKRSFIPVFTVMIKTSTVKNYSGFDESLRWNEDDDLWIRILIKGKAIYSDYVSGARRLHDSNMSKNRVKMTKYQLKSFKKWMTQLTLNDNKECVEILIRRSRIMIFTLIKEKNLKTLIKLNLFDYLFLEVIYYRYKYRLL